MKSNVRLFHPNVSLSWKFTPPKKPDNLIVMDGEMWAKETLTRSNLQALCDTPDVISCAREIIPYHVYNAALTRWRKLPVRTVFMYSPI